jgi:hypothetical protein
LNGASAWALAGPPRVNDRLQTCHTVYKSGTLVEAPMIPAFFCNISSLRLGHWMGLSLALARDIRRILHRRDDHFAKRNGFTELFHNTQCFVCFSGCVQVWEISFALPVSCSLPVTVSHSTQAADSECGGCARPPGHDAAFHLKARGGLGAY